MATVAFTHSVTSNGQLVLNLSSADLPAGELAFSLAFTYNAQSVRYVQTRFTGSSGSSISAGVMNGQGTIDVQGTLSPSANGFASFIFDAFGDGIFDANITSFTINGTPVTFTDPAPYAYHLPLTLTETLAITQDMITSGTFNPFDTYSPEPTVKVQGQHGTVTFSDMINRGEWTYTPEPGFYGRDSFTIAVSQGGSTKEKTFVLDISPRGTPNYDTFHASAADYTVDGREGIDTLVYKGAFANFTIARNEFGFTIVDKTGAEGNNELVNVERIKFADKTFALDVDGNAGQAYRLYQAAFNRTPDGEGLAFWIGALDKGVPMLTVAQHFIQSAEFQTAYGSNLTNDELVRQFYQNILHRAGDPDGIAFWKGVLDDGVARSAVLAAISESDENRDGLAALIGNGFAIPDIGG
jgi:hypothetical protein